MSAQLMDLYLANVNIWEPGIVIFRSINSKQRNTPLNLAKPLLEYCMQVYKKDINQQRSFRFTLIVVQIAPKPGQYFKKKEII